MFKVLGFRSENVFKFGAIGSSRSFFDEFSNNFDAKCSLNHQIRK